jgi:hypothetical protein
MSPIMDTKNMEVEQWGWFIDLESNEQIIIKNKDIENMELERQSIIKKQLINEELVNKKKEKSEMILYLKKRYKFYIYNLILNLVCSVSIVCFIKFMIIL